MRKFSVEILRGLRLLKECKIIHCDIKPENILLQSVESTKLKIIDLGSSCFENEKVYTYIQSRFYRAPEIVLGIQYTQAIDMWSFGCVLYELAAGKELFPASNEEELLHLVMEWKGVPPKDLLQVFHPASSPRL